MGRGQLASIGQNFIDHARIAGRFQDALLCRRRARRRGTGQQTLAAHKLGGVFDRGPLGIQLVARRFLDLFPVKPTGIFGFIFGLFGCEDFTVLCRITLLAFVGGRAHFGRAQRSDAVGKVIHAVRVLFHKPACRSAGHQLARDFRTQLDLQTLGFQLVAEHGVAGRRRHELGVLIAIVLAF